MAPRRSESGIRLRGAKGRTVGNRQPTPVILIVCEGEKTEPNYFGGFPVPKQIREIHGLGMDPLCLVQEARKLQQQYKRQNGFDYGQVWCVFDRDEFPLDRLRQALQLANANGFQIAYSNPSFELWYLLHFRYSDRPMTRYECCSELGDWLKSTYEKSQKLYMKIEANQADAIKHATRPLAQYAPPDPANDNPSTTVHLLVQEINRYVRP